MSSSSREGAGDQRGLIDAALRQVERVGPASNSTIGTGEMQRAAGRLGLHMPERIPGYTLLDEIHRGGQGVVFRARQDSTQRLVAIKVMREGPFATADERARFDREVRILAQLKHPNIVSIYHSDVASHFFYYVMDYIDGEPLDAWSRRAERTLGEQVEVFGQISEALGAAHLRGVIHRDLKPGNIRMDRAGVPHVLDFGLSKLVDADEDASSMTLTGQFVGTAPWASPEQAAGDVTGLDVRTDVYSLGVLFYQMLTGRFPYDVEGSRHEVLRRISEEEPKRPRQLRPSLPVDLETIVLKCLQKDPRRRYQSAGELARDVRRYQADEPIEARRDSIRYMLRKQIKRHRVPAAIGVAFLGLVLVGLVTSVTFWRQAVVARRAESQNRWLAEENAREAQAQRARAEAEVLKAEAAAGFLEGILTSADPRSELGPETTARDLLASAEDALDEGALAGQPLVAERVRRTLARSYQGLGAYGDAARQYQAAAALISDETPLRVRIEGLLQHAGLLEDQAEFDAARAHFEEALELVESDPALGESELAASAMNGLGSVLRDKGELASAEEWLRRSVAIRERLGGARDAASLRSQTNLGLVLVDRGSSDEGLALLEHVASVSRETLPPDHPDLGAALSNLGDLLRKLKRPNEAIPIQREAFDVLRRSLPKDHPNIGVMLNNLAQSYQELDRYEEAEPLLEEALAITTRALGPEHSAVAVMTNNLGLVRQAQGKLSEAAEAFELAVDRLTRVCGRSHPNVALALYNLARVHAARGSFDEADPLVSEAYEIFERLQGAGHPRTLRCGLLYGRVLVGLGQMDAGVALLRELDALAEEKLAHDPETRMAIHYGLGAALLKAESYEEAEPYLLASHERLPAARADKRGEVLSALVRLYEQWDRPVEAARWRAVASEAGVELLQEGSVDGAD